MEREDLISTYRNFLHAFDLTPDDAILDKTCLDVIQGHAFKVDKLSVLLHPPTHRFVSEIIEHEKHNSSLMFVFLKYLDLHMRIGDVPTVTIPGFIGSAQSFLSAPTTRTLH